jgi:hypothetical protein
MSERKSKHGKRSQRKIELRRRGDTIETSIRTQEYVRSSSSDVISEVSQIRFRFSEEFVLHSRLYFHKECKDKALAVNGGPRLRLITFVKT